MTLAGSGGEEHDEHHRQEDQRRSQVGLLKDENDGYQHDHERNCQSEQLAVAVADHQIPRQAQHASQLGKFRWLESDRAESDPALRTVDRRKPIHREQQDQRSGKRGIAPARQQPVAGQRQPEHHGQANQAPQELSRRVATAGIGQRFAARDAQPAEDDQCAGQSHDRVGQALKPGGATACRFFQDSRTGHVGRDGRRGGLYGHRDCRPRRFWPHRRRFWPRQSAAFAGEPVVRVKLKIRALFSWYTTQIAHSVYGTRPKNSTQNSCFPC